MSYCTGCASKFSLLKKEIGCSQCGFSFCSKCLSKKSVVPRLSAQGPLPVCQKCYVLLTTTVRNPPSEPVFVSEMPQKVPVTSEPPIHVKLPTTLHYSVAEKDRNIQERLERLKSERRKSGGVPASEEEIARRLAALKGEEFTTTTNNIPKPDTRCDIQKSDDLISQIQAQVELERKTERDLTKDIEDRLAMLRSHDGSESASIPSAAKPKSEEVSATGKFSGVPNSVSGLPNSDSFVAQNEPSNIEDLMSEFLSAAKMGAMAAADDLNKDPKLKEAYFAALNEKFKSRDTKSAEADTASLSPDSEEFSEAQCEKAVAEVLAEADLELLNKLPAPKTEELPKEDELPWCSVCTEDAVIRCFDCDGDLYCAQCFRDAHDDFVERHRTTHYKSK